MSDVPELRLTQLGERLPAITSSFGAALAEACAICLRDQGHPQGIELQVSGNYPSFITFAGANSETRFVSRSSLN